MDHLLYVGRKMALYIIVLFLFLSCSGYHFRNLENPLDQYGIHELSIPMFQNRSSLPHVSGAFTKEVILLMQSFPALKVHSGEDFLGDAVLLGIIESPPLFKDTVSGSGEVELGHQENTGVGYSSLRGRKNFKTYAKASIQLSVRMILIKNPTKQEMRLLLSEEGRYVVSNSKVIFNEQISLSKEISRDVQNHQGMDSAGPVNFTKSKSSIDLSVRKMAKDMATQFKEAILYAF